MTQPCNNAAHADTGSAVDADDGAEVGAGTGTEVDADAGAEAGAGVGTVCCGELGALLSARLFRALSDPTRLGLLVRIADGAEPYTVGDLAREAPIDVSVVSRHLGVLRDAGIIECVRRGKEVRCSLRTADVVKALRDLADALESCNAGRGLGCGENATSGKVQDGERG